MTVNPHRPSVLGASDADRRTVLEIVGHRDALTYVQELAGDDHVTVDGPLLRSLSLRDP